MLSGIYIYVWGAILLGIFWRVLGEFVLDSFLLLCFYCFSAAFLLLRLFGFGGFLASVAFWLLRLFGSGGFSASCCQLLSGRSCNLLTFLGFVDLLP